VSPLALTLVAYVVVLIAIGWSARSASVDREGYFLGGRRLGGWGAALGASASSSSAWSLLGVSGAAYAWGLPAVWLIPGCVGGFVLNWLVFAPAVSTEGRGRGAATIIELVAGRPGTAGRPAVTGTAAAIVLVSLGAYVGAQLQGAAKTFEAVFAVPAWETVLVGAAVVLAYTWLGGFQAVSATDAVQGTVMVSTALLLPVAAVAAAGGPAGIWAALSTAGDPQAASLLRGATPAVGAGFALGLVGIGLGYPGQPHVGKYFLALSDDPRALRRGRAVAVTWAVVVYVGMVALGLAGRALYPELPDGETVFVAAADQLLPAAVAGVVLAAVLSAMMSTADSQLFVAAGTVTHDLGVRLPAGLAAGAVNREVATTRAVAAALTAGAAASALVGDEAIFSRVLFGWAAMGASLGPLLLVRVVLRRELPQRAAIAVLVVGAGTAAVAHLGFIPAGGPPALRGLAVHVVPYALSTGLAFAASSPVKPRRRS